MRQSTITAIRSYRVYLRDAENVLAQGHDVDLASDEDARELAVLMLNERTNFPAEVSEMALAHAVSDKVEAAYRRGDLYQKRRLLAESWAAFFDGRNLVASLGRASDQIFSRLRRRR